MKNFFILYFTFILFMNPSYSETNSVRRIQFQLVGRVSGDYITSTMMGLDTEQGQKVRVPKKLMKKFGYSGDEQIGSTIRLKITPEEAQQVLVTK